jgi:predicted DNA binding protein
MAVFVELTIPMESLEIGQATATIPESHIELEQIVPIGDGVVPYFWATVEDFDSFEASVREYELVDRLEHVATVDNRRLYRVYWAETGKFVDALTASDATVLEGHGSDPWTFRLLFPTREQVTIFREQCSAKDIPFDVRHVSELSDEVAEPQFGLTEQQHEALRLAVERGYYSIPRETTLADLAEEVGISQQAMSERLRRGTAKVLVNAIRTGSQPSQ